MDDNGKGTLTLLAGGTVFLVVLFIGVGAAEDPVIAVIPAVSLALFTVWLIAGNK